MLAVGSVEHFEKVDEVATGISGEHAVRQK